MKYLAQLKIPGADGKSQTIELPKNAVDISLPNLVSFGLNFLLGIGIILSLIFLLWGGITWIMSGGEKEKIDSARKTILFSIIGLVTIILSFFIVNFVFTLMGVQNDPNGAAPPSNDVTNPELNR